MKELVKVWLVMDWGNLKGMGQGDMASGQESDEPRYLVILWVRNVVRFMVKNEVSCEVMKLRLVVYSH